ncbi:MAG: hypothetical protein JJT89_18225, partial [Nitriliruptoraceae bacterium]|nr:hypothetical protein [Nitriliruptoraceae bacterium]
VGSWLVRGDAARIFARRSPFAAVLPAIVAAVGYLGVTLVWVLLGGGLPGGRWFAVHVFTLGVLTNVILAFSDHFARTVTRTPGDGPSGWWLVVANVGIVAMLAGLPARWLPGLASGAVVVSTAVVANGWRLRRMRRAAVGARFSWIVRVYERAHGAFIHGAVLGALLGVGLVTGPWYGAFRLAHLHAMVLGWGGLTLLATLVFFGPTMARTRIEPGADVRAARALRHGGTGLSVATLALIGVGFGGAWGTASRMVAAVGLGVFALAAVVVLAPVATAAWRAKPSGPRGHVIAVAGWLALVVLADVLVVASGAWRWLDAIGLVALTGVLAQAVVTTLLYLGPMFRVGDGALRETVRQRLERGRSVRLVVVQVAVAWIAVGALPLDRTTPVPWVPWVVLGGVLLAALIEVARPVRPTAPVDAR